MEKRLNSKTFKTLIACVVVALIALVVCGTIALAEPENNITEPEVDAVDEDVEATVPDILITADDIQMYCGMCHLNMSGIMTNDGMAIDDWNKTNMNAAIIESMMPMLDDDTIAAIDYYFQQIEPEGEVAE